jgi:hypothetical protein
MLPIIAIYCHHFLSRKGGANATDDTSGVHDEFNHLGHLGPHALAKPPTQVDLLCNETTVGVARKVRIATVVTHELSHMWCLASGFRRPLW